LGSSGSKKSITGCGKCRTGNFHFCPIIIELQRGSFTFTGVAAECHPAEFDRTCSVDDHSAAFVCSMVAIKQRINDR
jgi:hypothetical protein